VPLVGYSPQGMHINRKAVNALTGDDLYAGMKMTFSVFVLQKNISRKFVSFISGQLLISFYIV
jgi:hypothetical protein